MNTTRDKAYAYADIYDRYVDDASFLWLMRSIAVNQPHYNLNDIKNLEERIQAQIDGLMTSLEVAWPLCEKALELEGPGEMFTAAQVAFRSHDQTRIQKVVEAGFSNTETLRGLASSIAWLPAKISHPWIQKFLTSKDINHKHLAIIVCSIRRENPGEFLAKFLQRDDCLQHDQLYARCLRLIGELKRHDLAPVLNQAMSSKQKDVAFWANWSGILLGNKTLVQNIQPYVFNKAPQQDLAINMAFRVLPIDQARQWITKISGNQDQLRTVIKATGILGDPHAVDWLILKMKELKNARLAGEAFTLITGIDLEQHKLNQDAPFDYEPTPNEDAGDSNVALDDDENLPWPNADLIAASWKQIASRYTKGQRYLMGQDITPANINTILQHGYQRQRHAAAMELAINDVSQMLQNTRSKVMTV